MTQSQLIDALDMAVVMVDGTMASEESLCGFRITDEGWSVLIRVRLHVYRSFLLSSGFTVEHVNRFYPLEVTA